MEHRSSLDAGPTHMLRRDIGRVLTICLKELCEVRPADPFEYMAHWLYKSVDAELYFYEKTTFAKECQLLVLDFKRSQIKKTKVLEQINNKMKKLRAGIMKSKLEQSRLMDSRLKKAHIDTRGLRTLTLPDLLKYTDDQDVRRKPTKSQSIPVHKRHKDKKATLVIDTVTRRLSIMESNAAKSDYSRLSALSEPSDGRSKVQDIDSNAAWEEQLDTKREEIHPQSKEDRHHHSKEERKQSMKKKKDEQRGRGNETQRRSSKFTETSTEPEESSQDIDSDAAWSKKTLDTDRVERLRQSQEERIGRETRRLSDTGTGTEREEADILQSPPETEASTESSQDTWNSIARTRKMHLVMEETKDYIEEHDKEDIIRQSLMKETRKNLNDTAAVVKKMEKEQRDQEKKTLREKKIAFLEDTPDKLSESTGRKSEHSEQGSFNPDESRGGGVVSPDNKSILEARARNLEEKKNKQAEERQRQKIRAQKAKEEAKIKKQKEEERKKEAKEAAERRKAIAMEARAEAKRAEEERRAEWKKEKMLQKEARELERERRKAVKLLIKKKEKKMSITSSMRADTHIPMSDIMSDPSYSPASDDGGEDEGDDGSDDTDDEKEEDEALTAEEKAQRKLERREQKRLLKEQMKQKKLDKQEKKRKKKEERELAREERRLQIEEKRQKAEELRLRTKEEQRVLKEEKRQEALEERRRLKEEKQRALEEKRLHKDERRREREEQRRLRLEQEGRMSEGTDDSESESPTEADDDTSGMTTPTSFTKRRPKKKGRGKAITKGDSSKSLNTSDVSVASTISSEAADDESGNTTSLYGSGESPSTTDMTVSTVSSSEDSYESIVPVECDWELQDTVLVCSHPVLGEIRARKRRVYQFCENPEYWEQKDFHCRVFYHHEVYTNCKPSQQQQRADKKRPKPATTATDGQEEA